jgi:hypothetical protein
LVENPPFEGQNTTLGAIASGGSTACSFATSVDSPLRDGQNAGETSEDADDQQHEAVAASTVSYNTDTASDRDAFVEDRTPNVRNGEKTRDNDGEPPLNCAGDCEPCENRWAAHLRPQIEQIVISTLVCVTDCIKQRKNSIELFGYDFMIAHGVEDLNVWLLEVNRSPSVGYASRVKAPLVKKMMEDTAKVLADLPMDPTASTGDWELIQHEMSKPLPGKPCENVQLAVHGEKLTLPRPRGRKAKA